MIKMGQFWSRILGNLSDPSSSRTYFTRYRRWSSWASFKGANGALLIQVSHGCHLIHVSHVTDDAHLGPVSKGAKGAILIQVSHVALLVHVSKVIDPLVHDPHVDDTQWPDKRCQRSFSRSCCILYWWNTLSIVCLR